MKFEDVPGWISVTDQYAFQWVLEHQNASEPAGDLVELGAFKGKSAIQIGHYRKYGEKFTVCDLFEEAAVSSEINPEAGQYYKSLTQKAFEDNYAAFHAEMPTIIRGPSSCINDHVAEGSCRFVHVDASHMYEHVLEDAHSAKRLLRENGIVVFDDYRAEHTPGTAAAMWEMVATGGLKPVFHTVGKFYGTWGDPEPMQQAIIRKAAQSGAYTTSSPIYIRDMPIIRMYWVKPTPGKSKAPAKAQPKPEHHQETRPVPFGARLRTAAKVLLKG